MTLPYAVTSAAPVRRRHVLSNSVAVTLFIPGIIALRGLGVNPYSLGSSPGIAGGSDKSAASPATASATASSAVAAPEDPE